MYGLYGDGELRRLGNRKLMMPGLTKKALRTGKIPAKEGLKMFCEDWNRGDFSVKLYPLNMVPESLAENVAKAQLDVAVDGAVELPKDVHDEASVLEWARNLEAKDLRSTMPVAVQVAAVDKKGRLGVFDVEVSIGPNGYLDSFTDIKVITTLTGFSRRKAWVDPAMLETYANYVKTGRKKSYDDSEERIFLFQKGVQAMIRDKIKDVGAKVARINHRQLEQDRLEKMKEELLGLGVPMDKLVASKKLESGVFDKIGTIELEGRGFLFRLTTASTRDERMAFAEFVEKVGLV